MNEDTLKGQWKQIKGKAQQKWGKLTNDDWDRIQGKREELEGRIQERYGRTKEDVAKEVDTFLSEF